MKRCISLILAFVFVIGVFATVPLTPIANAVSVDDLIFELNEDGTMYQIKDCNEYAEGELVIPSAYNGLPVTRIGSYAFEDCSLLTSITIPDSVTSIGREAFKYCTALTSVIIGNGVISIDYGAFAYCLSLTSITIGNSIKSIGQYAFYGCKSLTSVYLTQITNWCDIDFQNYSSNPLWYAKKLHLNGNLVTKLTIPNSVKSINDFAFLGCSSFISVTLGNNVTTIGYCAFADCTSLTSVTLGDNVTSLDRGVFGGCTALTSITIPDGLDRIGYVSIGPNGSITSVIPDAAGNIPAHRPGDREDSFFSYYSGAFEKCVSLTSITIPDTLRGFAPDTFSGCISLTSVTIGNSVMNIGGKAFYDCFALTSVTIPASVTYIGSKAFGYKYSSWEETDVKIPNFTISGVKGTAAEDYAIENGFTFIEIEGTKPHEHTYTSSITKHPTYTETGVKTFTCTICGDSYTEVIPKLERLKAPTITSITSEQNGVKITWNAVNGADEYVVFKLIDGVYKDIAVVGASILSFTDQTAVDGETYCYAVATKDSMGNVGQYSEFAHTYKKITSLATPTVKVANASNGVKVTWNAIENAESYKVYRKTYNTKTKKYGDWKTCGTVTATSYVDTNAKSGTKYIYTVKALNGDVKSGIKSSSSILYLSQPTVKIANASTGVKVKWNKITGATGYKVYRSVYSNGKWSGWKSVKTIDKGSTTSWTDKKVTSGVKYKYTVKAVNGKTTSTYKSSSSLLYLAQPTVTVKAVSNGVKVAWTQSTGATGYTVYRSEYNAKTKKWSSWKGIKTAKSTSKSYTDKTAKKGVKYRYTVKAVNGKVASTYKASGSVKR